MRKINIDLDKMIQLHNEGLTPSEIGAILNVKEFNIRNRLKELGIKRNSKVKEITPDLLSKILSLNSEGRTNEDIAGVLHLTPTTVRKYLVRNCKEFNSVKVKPLTKRHLTLTEEQKEVLYGSLLGDMSIEVNWKNAKPVISHGGDQLAYFNHKCKIFEGLLGKPSTTPRYDKRTNKWYNKYAVKFLANPFYTALKAELYPGGIKTITQDWLNKLTERSLAFWFMDDGCNSGTLATICFTLEECQLLQGWLYGKWGIKTTLQRQINNNNLQYLVYIRNESKPIFYDIVKPYIIPEMMYKIHGWNLKPSELRGTP